MENLPEQLKKILRFIKNISEDGISVTRIAKGIKASYGNVFKSINKLEKFGLIKKRRILNNRVDIILTEKGENFISFF